MPMMPLSALIPVAMALTPLGPAQEARLAAWLNWGAAYRDCYEPAPFGMRIASDGVCSNESGIERRRTFMEDFHRMWGDGSAPRRPTSA